MVDIEWQVFDVGLIVDEWCDSVQWVDLQWVDHWWADSVEMNIGWMVDSKWWIVDGCIVGISMVNE